MKNRNFNLKYMLFFIKDGHEHTLKFSLKYQINITWNYYVILTKNALVFFSIIWIWEIILNVRNIDKK